MIKILATPIIFVALTISPTFASFMGDCSLKAKVISYDQKSKMTVYKVLKVISENGGHTETFCKDYPGRQFKAQLSHKNAESKAVPTKGQLIFIRYTSITSEIVRDGMMTDTQTFETYTWHPLKKGK